jgi:hypothetical protein
MGENRTDIGKSLLHMNFHQLTKWGRHHQRCHVVGAHDDATQLRRVDVRR